MLPISDMEEAQFILYLQTEMGFTGKGKLSSELSVEARGELVRFAAFTLDFLSFSFSFSFFLTLMNSDSSGSKPKKLKQIDNG